MTSLVTATELVNCIFLLWSGSILIFFLPEKKEVRKSRKLKKREKKEKKKRKISLCSRRILVWSGIVMY